MYLQWDKASVWTIVINFTNVIKEFYWWIKSGSWITMNNYRKLLLTTSQVWSIKLTCIFLQLRLDSAPHYLMNWKKKNSVSEVAAKLDYKPRMKRKGGILFREGRASIRFSFCVWFLLPLWSKCSEKMDWVDGYHAVSHCAAAQQWPTWESLAGGALN